MNLSAKHKRIFLALMLSVTLVGSGTLVLASSAWAAPAAPAAPKWFRLVPECATAKGTPGSPPPVPSLVCALQTFGNIAQIILGLTGSLALLMFVYGGFLLVTSAGSQEKVSQGKKAITNAVIGILIIMTSGLLIQYGLDKIELSEGYKAIGVHCTDDNTPISTGKGQFVQLPDGTLKCAQPLTGCDTDLKKYNFSCMNVMAEGKGLYCIANLCPNLADPENRRNNMCCYTPPR